MAEALDQDQLGKGLPILLSYQIQWLHFGSGKDDIS